MDRAELSGEDPLVEPSVARAQHRPAVPTELGRDAEPRRQDVPGVQRALSSDRVARFLSRRVEGRYILARRPAVVEPQADVDSDAVVERDGIACEERDHVRASAGDRRFTVDLLERRGVVVFVSDAAWNHGRRAMFASFELDSGPQLVVRAEPRGLIAIED